MNGWMRHIGLAMAGKKNPWGDSEPDSSSGEGGSGDDGAGPLSDTPPPNGPKNPWEPGPSEGPKRRSASIEEIFRKRPGGPDRVRRPGGGGGNGGGFNGLPKRPDGGSYVPWAIGLLVIVLIGFTCFHRVAPQEKAVVTFLGSYSRTLGSGVNFTLPWPLENVEKVDVQEIRTNDIPQGNAEKLILTSDQNLVDLAYSVRWNIKDPTLFLFQLAEPEETVIEVAEAAMRASVAEATLDDAIGSGRTEIEQNVQLRMQDILDEYRSGVQIQGIAIKKADPPASVNDAFKAVSAAQQDAQTEINQARAYAQQITARAQGEAAAFDKVYEEYRLAPGVTRRRMYYETMESVLSQIDKTIVEAQGVTPYLPLPEINRRRNDANTSAPPTLEGQR